MGRVDLLVDPIKLSRLEIDVEVSDATQIVETRERIWTHLRDPSSNLLRIRMNEVLFQRFRDFDGLNAVRVTPVSARTELANRLGGDLPHWCDDELVLAFDLLNSSYEAIPSSDEVSIDHRIIRLISRDLMASDGADGLLYLIFRIGKPIAPLFKSNIFSQFVFDILAKSFTESTLPQIYLYLQSENCTTSLSSLYQEAFYEGLREFQSRTQLSMALPARQFPKELVARLRVTANWWEIVEKDKVLLPITLRAIEKIRRKELDAEKLAELVFGYHLKQLEAIVSSAESMPSIATVPLLNSIRALNTPDAEGAANSIAALLEASPPETLEENSSASVAIEWSERYLKYARIAFKRDQEPKAELGESFGKWVSSQPARLQNPLFNWRAVSLAVRDSLKRKNRVILIVVDALGSIVCDELVRAIQQQSTSLEITNRHLFAPLPTLTEIGKIAVVTGQDVNKLPNSQEAALLAAYKDVLMSPDELQIVKSWTGEDQHINKATKLLVFFENQLDDKLHECLDYKAFSDQLGIVCKNVADYVGRLFNGSTIAAKDIEVFITADHGLTRIARIRENQNYANFGTVSARCIRTTSKLPVPDGFYAITPEGAESQVRYLVCEERERLIKQPQPFVHGGLTPEEVIIPLVTVCCRNSIQTSDYIKIALESNRATLTTTGWLVALEMAVGNAAMQSVVLEAHSPFQASYTWPSISANSSFKIPLEIQSSIPQTGYVQMKLKIRFVTAGNSSYSTIEKVLEIYLPERLLVKGQGVLDFNKMFD